MDAYDVPTRNWIICMVVRVRFSRPGMGTEKAVRV